MKYYIISLLSFLLITGCSSNNDAPEPGQEIPEGNETIAPDEIENKWPEYKSTMYHFRLPHPQQWSVMEFNFGENIPVINVFPETDRNMVQLPLTVHAIAGVSYIGIYPEGYGTELPMGRDRPLQAGSDSPVNFSINDNESKVFLLENDAPWGYFIVPENPPANWKNGFIFAQIAVNDFRTECIDKETGKLLDSRDCDPMLGDTVKRYGAVDEQMKEEVIKMLQNIAFSESDNDSAGDATGGAGIHVESPRPQSVISFPLQVKGEARGSWYFEAEFQVALKKNNETISEATVKAQDKWMTTDFVPFKATLPAPDQSLKGQANLVFSNSNPSGKPQNQKKHTITVVLPE